MRTRLTILTLALLVLFPALAAAQAQAAPFKPQGTFDIGFRASDVDGDAARFQRYQDLREQGASFNFSIDRELSSWMVKASGRNVGYRDQRFLASASSSRVTMSFEWNQTPLFYGNTTATAYVEASPGVFTLDPAARLAVQNGTALGIPRTPAQAQSVSIYRALSNTFDLRSRRDRAVFRLAYAATPDVALNVEVDSYARTGAQPWGAGFGFSALPELPVTLDNRTTDVSAGAEWANKKGMLRLGYAGSYFSNNVETLTWDNPVRATDYNQNTRTVTGYDPSGYVTGNGAAQGRMALAPSNHSHGVNGLGLLKLPSRSSLTAAFGVVGMKQDADLIPWTINPVIAHPSVYEQFPGLARLGRSSAEADVRLTNANLGFNTKPNRYFGLTAKYRYFDRDDRTPIFDATDYVRFDATPIAGGGSTRHLNLTRNTFNVDATVTPMPYTAFRVGVGRDALDHARAYSQLADTTLRASAHIVGHQYVGLRAMYERTVRDASGFDAAALTAGGAQPASRWYDDAGRTRNRTTLLVDVTPASFIGVNASMFVGDDDYDDADQQFGLLSNENTGYTVGLSIAPSPAISFGATYGYERYTALQRSRAANAAPDVSWTDPARDWDLDTKETVRTVALNLDLIRLLPKTEIRLGYDWTDSDQGFVYGGPRIDALASIGQFAPLPAVTNAWQRATADVRYFMTPRVGLGAGYWFNKFEVDDYQTLDLSDGTPRTDYVGSLMLGYGYRPFNANTGFLRIFYLF
jgi:MtrB/PioB family decaheme-associated outer membrane protein